MTEYERCLIREGLRMYRAATAKKMEVRHPGANAYQQLVECDQQTLDTIDQMLADSEGWEID